MKEDQVPTVHDRFLDAYIRQVSFRLAERSLLGTVAEADPRLSTWTIRLVCFHRSSRLRGEIEQGRSVRHLRLENGSIVVVPNVENPDVTIVTDSRTLMAIARGEIGMADGTVRPFDGRLAVRSGMLEISGAKTGLNDLVLLEKFVLPEMKSILRVSEE
jgi:hypothetical protein